MSAEDVRESKRYIWLQWALMGAALALAFYLLVASGHVGVDYWFNFGPVPRDWLAGFTALYDENSLGFYNPPWTIFLLFPFSLLPLREGMAALTLFSVVSVILAVAHFTPPGRTRLWATVLALFNLHTFDLLNRGQLDAFPLLGIFLGFWALRHRSPWVLGVGFFLLSIKPQSVFLIALIYLWKLWAWPLADRVRALALPLVVGLSSFVIFGLDWPRRLIDSYRLFPPRLSFVVTPWQAMQQRGIPLWLLLAVGLLILLYLSRVVSRTGLHVCALSLAVVVNALLAPYLLSYNLVLILAVSFAYLFSQNALWGLAAYLTTYTPLLRVPYGLGVVQLDILFPLSVFALLAWHGRRVESCSE